jgi:hypothetical protein
MISEAELILTPGQIKQQYPIRMRPSSLYMVNLTLLSLVATTVAQSPISMGEPKTFACQGCIKTKFLPRDAKWGEGNV